MPVLVNSIIGALPEMSNVALLCVMFVTMYGALGTELFKGTLHYRCAAPGFEETEGHPLLDWDPLVMAGHTPPEPPRAVYTSGRALKGASGGAPEGITSGQKAFDSALFCNPHSDSVSSQCPADFPTCSYFDDNINSGVTTFDSFGFSFVAIMQTLTFDSWTIPMYALLDTTPILSSWFIR